MKKVTVHYEFYMLEGTPLEGFPPNAEQTIRLLKPAKSYQVTDGLNVRTMPSTTASIVGKLPKGFQVNVYELSNGWARVGPSFWVFAKYLVEA